MENDPKPNPDSTTQLVVAERKADEPSWADVVAKELKEPFEKQFHKALDRQLVESIAEDLSSQGEQTPVAYFWNAIVLGKLRGNKPVTPGLLVGSKKEPGLPRVPGLAHDAAVSWASLPAAIRARYLPAPSAAPSDAPRFEVEPEGTGSPWDLVRAGMREKVTPQEHENWLARSAFISLKNRVLRVRVPDPVTGDFLDQVYREDLLAITAELGLSVDRFEWEPAS